MLCCSRYSDDEDTSYKIRRSATKVLTSVIGTRPELLGTLYKSVSPVLISRFGDREESVRLEIWATYVLLLTQTGVYGDQVKDADSSPVGGKRKREEEGEMDVEETPYTLLRSQVPSLAKALLKQLQSSKTPPATLQAGFSLLLVLLTVLPGCLANQVTPVMGTTQAVLSQSPTTATSTLHVTVLSFLALFFATHSAATFSASLPMVTPALLKSVREKHPRVAAEAFRVFSALLVALKPVGAFDWTDSVYNEAVCRLKANDTDAEVRERAGEIIADLWVSAPDIVKKKDGQEWQALLRPAGRTEGPVKVVKRVATEADVDDQWINACIDWVSNILRKSGRTGKFDAFVTLNTLISKCVLRV
jgi:cullin-associated NEDD8-dissociated protein 1